MPTAQTSLPLTAATPFKLFKLKIPLGPLTTLQALPSQCSISIRSIVPLLYKPTAQTSLLATAATAFKVFALVPGLGLFTMLQALPSQCIVSVCPTPVPTAQ